jgi:hypothetical protein
MQLPADVVAYIEELDSEHRKLFDELHELILETIPEAEVRFSIRSRSTRWASSTSASTPGRRDASH